MEESMETTIDLPTKRPVVEVEVGSGSASLASKKAKVGSGYDNCDDEYWELGSFEEFSEFCNRSDEIRERYDHDCGNMIYEWKHYLVKLQNFCKFREIQLFLRSQGKVKEGDEVQSLDEKQTYKLQFSSDFEEKGWLLRATPGRYTDYQRLYVDNIYDYEDGELNAEYAHLYCTYASDLAFQKLFEELQSLIKWDLSWSDADGIGEDASKKYRELDPKIVGYAVEHALRLKREEQEKKERVPLFTKLWREIVRKERDAVKVLIEIIDSDTASFPASINSIKNQLWKYEKWKQHPPCLRTLGNVKRYIDAASTEGPRGPVLIIYADYLEKKLAVAEKLGLTT